MSESLGAPFAPYLYDAEKNHATLKDQHVVTYMRIAGVLAERPRAFSCSAVERDWAECYPQLKITAEPGGKWLVTCAPGIAQPVPDIFAQMIPRTGMRATEICPGEGDRTYTVQFYTNGLCLIEGQHNRGEFDILKHGLRADAPEDGLEAYFWCAINMDLPDPFLQPGDDDWGSESIEYAEGYNGAGFEAMLRLCLLTEPGINDRTGQSFQFEASDGEYGGAIIGNSDVNSPRLEALVDALCTIFEPRGWSRSYNDGASDRESGYTEGALRLVIEIAGEYLTASARDRMKAYGELCEWFTQNGLTMPATACLTHA